MIEIKDLSFTYSNSPEPSLYEINLKINEGEFVLITGPSGSGKSTLVRLINSLIPHYYGGILTGRVKVYNYDTITTPTRKLAGIVGMVFQNPENQMLLSDVESEITFGMENLGFTRQDMSKILEETLNNFEIQHLRKKNSTELSGGEKQKVAIASVLAMNPKIIILDEPTAELDPKSSQEILNLLHDLNKNLGITILLIEHRLDRVTDFIKRIVVLGEGKIVFDGDLKDCFYNWIDLDLIGIETPPIIKLYKEYLNFNPMTNLHPLNLNQCKDSLRKNLEILTLNNNKLKFLHDGHENTYNNISDQPIVVDISNIWFEYGKGNFSLQNINLKIHRGEFITIIGRNGSGKTTLSKLINGLLRPSQGRLFINNSDISGKTVAEISHSVGYIFQNPSIQFYQDSVEEELLFVLKNFGIEKEERKPRKKKGRKEGIKRTERIIFENSTIDKLLNQFQLEKYRNTYPRNLSIGEQQKTALASVLSVKPEILILDEPTHGMDYRQKTKFMNYLNRYRNQGNTVILISHDIETVAEFSERIILLQKGKIIKDGSKRSVLSEESLFSPQINRLVKEFENIPNEILTVKDMMEVLKNEN